MRASINHVVFDLDDTLYKEQDFVISAYDHIISFINKEYNYDFSHLIETSINENYNLYENIIKERNINFTLEKFLELYRYHYPKINLDDETSSTILKLKKSNVKISIITDGRSVTQRNKISSLGILNELSMILISEETGYEKPDKHNFILMQNFFPDDNFVYVGDNTTKDFIAPNQLGWHTVCLLDNGRNIHEQSFNMKNIFLPKSSINSLKDLVI